MDKQDIIRKRIGKDLACRWSILTNGEPTPLEGRDLTLEIRDRTGVTRELPFETDGNAVMFCFEGTQQRALGQYIVTLWENKGVKGQTAVDNIAFELVQYSWQESGDGKQV